MPIFCVGGPFDGELRERDILGLRFPLDPPQISVGPLHAGRPAKTAPLETFTYTPQRVMTPRGEIEVAVPVGQSRLETGRQLDEHRERGVAWSYIAGW